MFPYQKHNNRIPASTHSGVEQTSTILEYSSSKQWYLFLVHLKLARIDQSRKVGGHFCTTVKAIFIDGFLTKYLDDKLITVTSIM